MRGLGAVKETLTLNTNNLPKKCEPLLSEESISPLETSLLTHNLSILSKLAKMSTTNTAPSVKELFLESLLVNDLSSVIDRTFSMLGKLENERISNSTANESQSIERKTKNRYQDIVPFDDNRVKLFYSGGDDYINASYFNSIDGKGQWISTQGPLKNTVKDFWQMIYEHDSHLIVMLTQEEERGRIQCEKYWPTCENSELKFTSIFPCGKLELEVKYIGEESKNDSNQETIIRKFILNAKLYETIDSNSSIDIGKSLSDLSLKNDNEVQTMYKLISECNQEVAQFQCLSWQDGKVGESKTILDLIELVNNYNQSYPISSKKYYTDEADGKKLERSIKNKIPILELKMKGKQKSSQMIVHCSAGCGRTASFLSILSVLDILSTNPPLISHVEDANFSKGDLVALQINQFRRDRILAVQTRSQLLFCYDAIVSQLVKDVQNDVLLDKFG